MLLTIDATWRRRLARIGYATVGLMIFLVLLMSILEIVIIYNAGDISAFGAVQSNSEGLPSPNQRGAFLLLNPDHSPQFPGNLLELLATTEPGVVSTTEGAHLKPNELRAVFVQAAVVSDASEYRVYRIGQEVPDKMTSTRQQGGRSIKVVPANGTWAAGAYLVDVPSEGMFGGRQYYQFYIDAAR